MAECAWRAARRVTASTTDVAGWPTPTSPVVTSTVWLTRPATGFWTSSTSSWKPGTGDDAAVGDLAARLGVQSRLGEDHLDDLARARAIDGHAVDQDAEHGRLGLEVGVPGEDGLALGPQVAIDARVGELALARPRVRLRARPLLLHEGVERGAVDGEARLLRDLERQVDREAVGVVQEEGLGPRQRCPAGGLRLRERLVEDRRSRREGAQERLLLGERVLGDALPVGRDDRVGVLHRIARHGEQLAERRLVDAQQPHRADRAAHQPAEDVAAPVVRGRHAVREQHERGADVVGDHPEADVVLVVRAVAAARELRRRGRARGAPGRSRTCCRRPA